MSLEDDLMHARDKDELHRMIDALTPEDAAALVVERGDFVRVVAFGFCETTKIVGMLAVAQHLIARNYDKP